MYCCEGGFNQRTIKTYTNELENRFSLAIDVVSPQKPVQDGHEIGYPDDYLAPITDVGAFGYGSKP